MPSTKNFRTLEEQLRARPGAQEGLEQAHRELIEEVAEYDFEMSRQLSQSNLAERLKAAQPGGSSVEEIPDVRLSSLEGYAHEHGGELEINVRINGSTVRLKLADDSVEDQPAK